MDLAFTDPADAERFARLRGCIVERAAAGAWAYVAQGERAPGEHWCPDGAGCDDYVHVPGERRYVLRPWGPDGFLFVASLQPPPDGWGVLVGWDTRREGHFELSLLRGVDGGVTLGPQFRSPASAGWGHASAPVPVEHPFAPLLAARLSPEALRDTLIAQHRREVEASLRLAAGPQPTRDEAETIPADVEVRMPEVYAAAAAWEQDVRDAYRAVHAQLVELLGPERCWPG